jgi:hypothetical protein
MWKRLLGGLAVGVAALVAGVAVVPKAPAGSFHARRELAFAQAREELARDEQEAGERMRRLAEAVDRKRIDEVEFARRMQSEVVPIWERMAERMEAVEVPAGSMSRREWELMSSYVRTRRDAYRTLSPTEMSALGHDEGQIERYNQLIEEGDRAAEALRGEIARGLPGK